MKGVAERDAQRRAQLEERRRNRDPTLSENTTAWLADQERSVRAVKSELLRCRDVDKATAAEILAGLVEQVRSMQMSLTRASAFLAAYDVQRGQKEVAALEQLVRGTKTRLLAKKDFSFDKSRARQVLPEHENKANSIPNVGAPAAASVVEMCRNQDVEMRDVSNFGHVENYMDSRIVVASNALFAMKLSRLQGCRVAVGPVRGSVFVEGCNDCDIYVCSSQLRIHNCERTRFHVFVQSDPIIEDCTEIVFSPDYECPPFAVPDGENKWKHVRDFNSPIDGSSRNFVLKE